MHVESLFIHIHRVCDTPGPTGMSERRQVAGLTCSRCIVPTDGDNQLLRMVTPFGRSPLHVACAATSHDVIGILLNAGYNPLQPDRFLETPADVARRFNASSASFLFRSHLARSCCGKRRLGPKCD